MARKAAHQKVARPADDPFVEQYLTDNGIRDFVAREKARGAKFVKKKGGVTARDLPAECLFASGKITKNELIAAQTYSHLFIVAHHFGRYPSTLEYVRSTNAGRLTELWTMAIRRLADLQRRAFPKCPEALGLVNKYCGEGEPLAEQDASALADAIRQLGQIVSSKDRYVFE